MSWKICFTATFLILILGIGQSISLGRSGVRRNRILNSFNVLFGMVFTASVVMFFPIYSEIFAEEPFWSLKVFLDRKSVV